MQGKKNYQEKLFTHFQLSDYVPADNFYRKLRAVLPMEWLRKETAKYYGKEGQQSIDPVVFMKLVLVGYLENLNSDRQIIRTAGMRLDILYFVGYDIDERLPWHSTLSRTRQLYEEQVFKKLFRQVLELCINAGLVLGKRQAMDSVFVKANASMDSMQRKEILDDGDDYTDELKANEDGSDKDNEESDQPKSGAVGELKAASKKGESSAKGKNHEVISNSTHQSTTDKDARISTKPGKPRRLNYLAQVSVDTANHVITQIQSEYADKKDSQSLPSLLEHTIENLEEHGLEVKEVLADGNYSSGEALRVLQANNIKAYIPNFGQYKSERKGFIYDEANDRYICSQGKYLLFKNIRSSHGKENKMKQYRSSGKDCSTCPLRKECIGKNHEKTISVTVDKALYDQMHERMQTSKAEWMRKKRSSTVEPVLGTLINYMGMSRINTKGIKQADKCMTMSAVAYNLKKLMKWESKKPRWYVNMTMNTVKNAIEGLFFYLYHTYRALKGYSLEVPKC